MNARYEYESNLTTRHINGVMVVELRAKYGAADSTRNFDGLTRWLDPLTKCAEEHADVQGWLADMRDLDRF